MFGIYHEYDVDGGYGDAIPERRLILVTEDEETAMEYVKRWSEERVYYTPYDDLYCGRLVYDELPRLITRDDISGSPYELVGESAKPYGGIDGDDWSGNYSDYKED